LKQDGEKKSPNFDGSSHSTTDGAASDTDQVSDGGAAITKMESNDLESMDFSDSNSSQSFGDLQSVDQSLDCAQNNAQLGTSSMGLTELFKSEFYD